jgi:hypothetical protein
MAESKTAAQVRDEYLAALGPRLGPLYYALYGEVTWLHAEWNQYRILFATEHVELLNRVAPFFFRVIHGAISENLVMHIARLTDPAQAGRGRSKDNLTLLRLNPNHVPELAAPENEALSRQLSKLIAKAEAEATWVRDWRNRRFAHRDLELAVDGQRKPLPRISRERMERTLDAVEAVLNKVEDHFLQNKIAFKHVITRDDAESLVYYLKIAVDAETRERERRLHDSHTG